MNSFKLQQHQLDAKIHAFMKKKQHQFPELTQERYYIEPATSLRPIEKHLNSTKRSHILPTMRLSNQY